MKSSLVFFVSWWLIPACGSDDDAAGGDWPDKLYLALSGGETAVRLAEEPPEPY